MKTLTLMRHAKTSWKYPHLADRDRPLNNRGKHDLRLIGQRLYDLGVKPDGIFSSPAKRAINTAHSIADFLEYPRKHILFDESIYTQDAAALLRLAHELSEHWGHVLLIGHNPTLTAFANKLLADARFDNIPTCGVVSITLPAERWCEIENHRGKLTLFDMPKQLASDNKSI